MQSAFMQLQAVVSGSQTQFAIYVEYFADAALGNG
jgi:hypothetical protein